MTSAEMSPGAHALQMQYEAGLLGEMATYARSLDRERAGTIADIVAFFRSESAQVATEQGIVTPPRTELYREILDKKEMDVSDGEKIIFAANGLVVAKQSIDRVDITPENFLRIPPPTVDRRAKVRSLRLGDKRAVDLFEDIYSLTGIPYPYRDKSGGLVDAKHTTPMGTEIIYHSSSNWATLKARKMSAI